MKLSKTQLRAYSKLTYQWKSPYELQESIRTLDSLVKLCNIKKNIGIGSMFCPRTNITYKKD